MSHQYKLHETSIIWLDNGGSTLDPAIPIKNLILFGEYRHVDGHITEEYFQSESCEAGVLPKLYSFKEEISLDDAVTFFASVGIRFATLRELLFLGTLFKESSLSCQIAIPGTIKIFPHLEGSYTPVLTINPQERALHLHSCRNVFNKNTYFAIVGM